MTQCASMSRGAIMRLTRLDECGAFVPGPQGSLVTTGYVQVVTTPVYQDAEEITQTNANGELCIDDQADPALRWLTTAITLCNIDPDAINILTGDPLVLNDATEPEAVGFRIDAAVTGTAAFALEVWSGIKGQPCAPGGGGRSYGYWLYPYIVQGQFGEWTVGNSGLTLELTARTSAGSGWGVGPYDVRTDATTGVPEPLLTPITATQHMHFEIVNAPLPTPGCGAVELPDPEALVDALVLEPA